MTLLLQDGRRPGHLGWATQAIRSGVASGVFISPFHTPRVGIPRHVAASKVVGKVGDVGGEAIFDPSTHARLLPNADNLTHYNTWQLWGPAGIGLDDDTRRLEHLERVFDRQSELMTPALAPTITLDSPTSTDARDALRTAQLAKGSSVNCWQSLAGRRSFWRTGPDLDAHVGQLAALKTTCWVITLVNDTVFDGLPELSDQAAITGLLRTVHSLSQRSRVIVSHGDYAGVPAIAAGAADLGTGWDRGMRFFDPMSFQQRSPGIRIAASYVTQGGLAAVLRRDTGDAITRVRPADALRLRGGPMPLNDGAERLHHLRQLHDLVSRVAAHGLNRQARVLELRSIYEWANSQFRTLERDLPRATLPLNQRIRWVDQPYDALKVYAEAEGLW